jgi:hypothetical protein
VRPRAGSEAELELPRLPVTIHEYSSAGRGSVRCLIAPTVSTARRTSWPEDVSVRLGGEAIRNVPSGQPGPPDVPGLARFVVIMPSDGRGHYVATGVLQSRVRMQSGESRRGWAGLPGERGASARRDQRPGRARQWTVPGGAGYERPAALARRTASETLSVKGRYPPPMGRPLHSGSRSRNRPLGPSQATTITA